MQINKLQDEASTIPAREIKGQRVVSYKQIAELHQIDTNNLQRNFNRNKSRFIEGTDYFKIKEQTSVVDNLSTWKYYFTESGYLMLVKSLTDDLSWEVQRMLVNSYFRASILDRVIEFLPIE
ncbi:MAG: ORF6N domain-containing protein, partial [Candidatus Cloacimonetes bacterium]|nr:ORF6N domain-containing protein [Candidatus Cloacimonadota bacterium]